MYNFSSKDITGQFWKENVIFFMVKQLNTALIQDAIAYNANIIRFLFCLLKEILILITSFLLFLVPLFWYSLCLAGFSRFLLLLYSVRKTDFFLIPSFLIFHLFFRIFLHHVLWYCILFSRFILPPSFWCFIFSPYFPGTLLFDILFYYLNFYDMYIFFIQQPQWRIFLKLCCLISNIWCKIFHIFYIILYYFIDSV